MENRPEKAAGQLSKQSQERGLLLLSSLASVLECKKCRQRFGNLALLTQHKMNCKRDSLATLAWILQETDAAIPQASTESRIPKPASESGQQQTTITPAKSENSGEKSGKKKRKTSGGVVTPERAVPTRKFYHGMSCKGCHEIFMTKACMTGHECDVGSDTIVEEPEEESEGQILKQILEKVEENVKKPIEEKLRCEECEFSCSQRFILKVHAKDHSAEKSYSCDECDYRCHESCLLKVHLRIHSGEKPYECVLCDFRSSQREKLKSHMRAHRGEKTRAKRAKHASLLEVTGEQDGGGRGFTVVDDVAEDVSRLCCVCTEKFDNGVELQLHMAMVHDKVYEQFVDILKSHATGEGNVKCSLWDALLDVASVRHMAEQVN